MKNILLVLVSFLFLVPGKLMAENTVTVISIQGKWSNEEDRSLLSVPRLSIDEGSIYVHSALELENLEIIIKDSLGAVLFNNIIFLSENATYSIAIGDLCPGEYTIQIAKGNSCIVGIAHIE